MELELSYMTLELVQIYHWPYYYLGFLLLTQGPHVTARFKEHTIVDYFSNKSTKVENRIQMNTIIVPFFRIIFI